MLSLQLMKYAIVPILIMCLTACHVKTKQANKRGLEYMKQNRYEQAVAEFNDILQEDAYWLPAYYNRAIALANTQQYKKALKSKSNKPLVEWNMDNTIITPLAPQLERILNEDLSQVK